MGEMDAPENICQHVVRRTKTATYVCAKPTYGYRHVYHEDIDRVELEPFCLKHLKAKGKL